VASTGHGMTITSRAYAVNGIVDFLRTPGHRLVRSLSTGDLLGPMSLSEGARVRRRLPIVAPSYLGGNPAARMRASLSISAESRTCVAVISLRRDFGLSMRTLR
jgi:hypothetical protein